MNDTLAGKLTQKAHKCLECLHIENIKKTANTQFYY